MPSRREVLKAGGAAVVVSTLGTPAGATGDDERWIVDTRGANGSLADADVEVVFELEADDLAVVRGPESAVEDVASAHAPDAAVAHGDPSAQSATDEPLYDYQWDKQGLSIPSVHEQTRGEGSRVVVLDSGLVADHPDTSSALNEDLSTNTYPGDETDDFADAGLHGTAVSGVLAADDENEAGITGVAPATDLVAVRITPPDSDRSAPFSAILAGLDYAASVDADVANVSYGALVDVSEPAVARFFATVLGRVTRRVYREGTLTVGAAGNESTDLDEAKPVFHLPSGSFRVLSVAATGPVGFDPASGEADEPYYRPAYGYTNYGYSGVEIAAPGGTLFPAVEGASVSDALLTTVPRDVFPSGTGYVLGTSFASPQVAGAAALLASEYDGRRQTRRLERALERGAAFPPFRSPYFEDLEYYGGRGYLDVEASFDWL